MRQLVGLEREKRKKKSQIWALPAVVLNFKNPLSLLLRRTIQRFLPPLPKSMLYLHWTKGSGKVSILNAQKFPRSPRRAFLLDCDRKPTASWIIEDT